MDEENVLGTALEPCSTDPTTGYERDGCCRHHPLDHGRHELCAVMTGEFLEYSKAQGNDLITPRPELAFPGLSPGDRWCVCIGRWVEAEEAGVAPPVVLEATNRTVLERVPRSTLEAYAHEGDVAGTDVGDRSSTAVESVAEGNGHGAGIDVEESDESGSEDGESESEDGESGSDDGDGNGADPPF